MKKIYEDYYNKFNENEINFFNTLKKEYQKRIEEDTEYNKNRIENLQNSLISNSWDIKREDSSLDIFLDYLLIQGFIKNYACDKNPKNYIFSITKLGLGFLTYISKKAE